MQPSLILFDLDGTLVDTAPDLGLALNMQRGMHGLPPLPMATIRPYASHGSIGLLSVGFGLTPEHPDFPAMRAQYLDTYDQVFVRSPILFPGIAELLARLEAQGLAWGVVTNKPRRFTQPLMRAVALDGRAACIIAGDDAVLAKPQPDTLLLACQVTGKQPADCLYVGDAERDIVAAAAAGMRSVVALYGYIDAHERPQEWGADYLIQLPADLPAVIEQAAELCAAGSGRH